MSIVTVGLTTLVLYEGALIVPLHILLRGLRHR